MEDRSNIIKEAIEYRKQLEKENAELKTENETLKSQLDFEVQKKEVLEAENERLKFKLDTVEADYEADEIEIEDLKNKLNLLTTANNHLLELDKYRQKELETKAEPKEQTNEK